MKSFDFDLSPEIFQDVSAQDYLFLSEVESVVSELTIKVIILQ